MSQARFDETQKPRRSGGFPSSGKRDSNLDLLHGERAPMKAAGSSILRCVMPFTGARQRPCLAYGFLAIPGLSGTGLIIRLRLRRPRIAALPRRPLGTNSDREVTATPVTRRIENHAGAGLSSKRLKGFEPSTFCMASRRSSQLSYSRTRPDSSLGRDIPANGADESSRQTASAKPFPAQSLPNRRPWRLPKLPAQGSWADFFSAPFIHVRRSPLRTSDLTAISSPRSTTVIPVSVH